jgi:hypothetical protein
MYRSHLLDRIAPAGGRAHSDSRLVTRVRNGYLKTVRIPVWAHSQLRRATAGACERRSRRNGKPITTRGICKCETAYNAAENDRRKGSEVWWRRRESNFSTVHGFCSLHILRKEESAQSDTLPDLSYAYRTQSFFSFDHSPTDRIRPLWCFVRSLATNVPDPRSDGLSPLMTAYDRDTDVEAPGH